MPRFNFAGAVEAELLRARTKHPTPIHSIHEGIAVIEEEFLEAREEVFHGKHEPLYRELVQLAAMCQRMAEDCNL